MKSYAERLALSEGFASDLLAEWEASGREDVSAETVEDFARMWGFLVDVPEGSHAACETCGNGTCPCYELRLPGDTPLIQTAPEWLDGYTWQRRLVRRKAAR